MFSESTGFTSFILSIFKVNYFCCVTNCLKINRVRICSANYLGIVTFKKLPAFFSVMTQGKRHSNLDSEIKAKENSYQFFCVSYEIKFLKDFEKMTGV